MILGCLLGVALGVLLVWLPAYLDDWDRWHF